MSRKRYDYIRFNQEKLNALVKEQLSNFSGELAKYANKRVKRFVSNRYVQKITGDLWRNTGAFEKDGKIYVTTTWQGVILNESKALAFQKIGNKRASAAYLKRYHRLNKTRGHVSPQWKKAKKRPFVRDAINATIKRAYTLLKRVKNKSLKTLRS